MHKLPGATGWAWPSHPPTQNYARQAAGIFSNRHWPLQRMLEKKSCSRAQFYAFNRRAVVHRDITSVINEAFGLALICISTSCRNFPFFSQAPEIKCSTLRQHRKRVSLEQDSTEPCYIVKLMRSRKKIDQLDPITLVQRMENFLGDVICRKIKTFITEVAGDTKVEQPMRYITLPRSIPHSRLLSISGQLGQSPL